MALRHRFEFRSIQCSLLCSLIAFWVLTFHPASACDWDSETLLQERARFPTALEVIVGKFPRHSDAYYQWRLEDRLKKLETRPEDDRLLDDVAVSYEKLKRYDEALAVTGAQLQRVPLRYETLANHGTILIHRGDLEAGVGFIEKAIEVNPDAHFGREKYQVILVKYILSRSVNGEIQLPLASKPGAEGKSDEDWSDGMPFVRFLSDSILQGDEKYLSKSQVDEAIEGVLGMMRFSRHDSPILLEVFGELQLRQGARQLAFRAYKSAERQSTDASVKRQYGRLASRAIQWSLESWREVRGTEVSEEEIEAGFAAELADAEVWFAGVSADEAKWIADGEPVDERFNEKYRVPPTAITTDPPMDSGSASNSATRPFIRAMIVASLIGLVVVAAIAWVVARAVRRRVEVE